MVRTTAAPAPLDPVFAMAGSDPVDGGSHLAQIACRADGCRRMDICWPKPAAASRHRTLSLTIIFGFIQINGVPRTTAILHPIIFFLLMLFLRLSMRFVVSDYLHLARGKTEERRRLLIYGAGRGGQLASLRPPQITRSARLMRDSSKP